MFQREFEQLRLLGLLLGSRKPVSGKSVRTAGDSGKKWKEKYLSHEHPCIPWQNSCCKPLKGRVNEMKVLSLPSLNPKFTLVQVQGWKQWCSSSSDGVKNTRILWCLKTAWGNLSSLSIRTKLLCSATVKAPTSLNLVEDLFVCVYITSMVLKEFSAAVKADKSITSRKLV